ncbi:protein terminus-like [Zeugodacus cucurbitae]|uniref:protein terminus-like n=1 Tax=Zeugodacus cucurbitae TaxID=28588 RepID=UPI0023D9381F|nr:protein terminus-like [Zeugodacus cucurbitae]
MPVLIITEELRPINHTKPHVFRYAMVTREYKSGGIRAPSSVCIQIYEYYNQQSASSTSTTTQPFVTPYQYHFAAYLQCPTSASGYEEHWSKVGRSLCSDEQRTQLKTIEEQGITNFILCNDHNRSTNGFLLDAGIQAIPQLLRLLFHDTARLHFRLSFYTRVLNETDFLFASSELTLEHHLDISETVDVLFLMLLEKIEAYMYACYPTRAAEYSVKRIKIYVYRELITSTSSLNALPKYILPLQYRVKHATAAPATKPISAETADDANLYCFRVCARTQDCMYFLISPVNVQAIHALLKYSAHNKLGIALAVALII